MQSQHSPLGPRNPSGHRALVAVPATSLKQRQRKLAGKYLVSDPNDIFYYTGFMPTAQSFLVFPGSVLYVSDLDSGAYGLKSVAVERLKPLKKLRLQGAGFDETHINAGLYLKLRSLKLRPASAEIKAPRHVKSSEELSLIRSAIRTAESSFRAAEIKGTEAQAAASIDLQFLKRGCRPSFETIIAAGKNSAFPHHHPGAEKISKAAMAIVDFGVRKSYYCTDTTRTFFDRRNKKQLAI